MAHYRYEGRERTGKKRKGTIIAQSRREAILKLRERGTAISELEEIQPSLLQREITIGKKVKFQEFVIFLRQFSTLLQAGVTILESIEVLAAQTENKAFKNTLTKMEEDIRTGNPLSEAAAMHPTVFPAMFINMVHAGEVGGNMDETLDRLATYFEKQNKTRQKIVSALAYPIVVGLIAIGVVIFLLTSVVPTFAGMFAGLGAELPTITVFVLNASDWMGKWWWVIMLTGPVFYLIFTFFHKNASTRYLVEYAILRMPLFGKLLQKAALAKMSRTLSSLFSSSVPILQALSIVEKVVDNSVLSKVLNESQEALSRGRSLTDPMKKHWIFPPLVIQMIAIGEKTGSLDLMLAKVADFYEQELEMATDRLKSLIEPLMIVLLAAIVGTIVTSVLVPMFEIFSHVQT